MNAGKNWPAKNSYSIRSSYSSLWFPLDSRETASGICGGDWYICCRYIVPLYGLFSFTEALEFKGWSRFQVRLKVLDPVGDVCTNCTELAVSVFCHLHKAIVHSFKTPVKLDLPTSFTPPVMVYGFIKPSHERSLPYPHAFCKKMLCLLFGIAFWKKCHHMIYKPKCFIRSAAVWNSSLEISALILNSWNARFPRSLNTNLHHRTIWYKGISHRCFCKTG